MPSYQTGPAQGVQTLLPHPSMAWVLAVHGDSKPLFNRWNLMKWFKRPSPAKDLRDKYSLQHQIARGRLPTSNLLHLAARSELGSASNDQNVAFQWTSWCHQRLRTDMSPDGNVVNNYKPCASLRARPKRQTRLASIKANTAFLTPFFWQQCGTATADPTSSVTGARPEPRLAPFRLTGFEKRRYVCRVLRSLI